MAGYSDKDHFRFVLLGKTGSGKSTTGNTLLGKKAFKGSGGFESQTDKCQWNMGVRKDGTTVEVVDTPGLCDTRMSDNDTATIITQTMTGMHPGAHAMIYVIKSDRFTEEEDSVFKKLEAIFDHRLYNYLIVVITGGDNLEADGMSVKDVINNAPKSLKKLLKDCDNRYIVFNNRSKDPTQVDKLLRMVKELVRKNGSKPHYSCDKYAGLGKEIEKEVKKRLGCVEESLLEKKEVFRNKMEVHKREMKRMTEDHEKQLKAKEEEVRGDIKREAMESKSSFWKKLLGATLVIAGMAVAAPVALVATVPAVVAGAGASAVAGFAGGALLGEK